MSQKGQKLPDGWLLVIIPCPKHFLHTILRWLDTGSP